MNNIHIFNDMLFSVCRSTDSDPLIPGSCGGPHLLGFSSGLAPLSSINSVSSSSAKGGNGVDVGDGGGVDIGDGDGVGDGVGDGGVSSSGLKSPSKGLFKSNSSIP